MNNNLKLTKPLGLAMISLALGLIAYGLSFVAYLYPACQLPFFLLAGGFMLVVALYDLRWGLSLALSELILGSKGHLLAWDLGGFVLSLRMLWWLILLSVWLFRSLANWRQLRNWPSWRLASAQPLYLLALSVLAALAVAWWRGNDYGNIVLDFNAWLFWLLLLPAWSLDWRGWGLKLKFWLAGSLSALSLATLLVLFAFAHNFLDATIVYYGWLRDAGLAEVTAMADGYFRVFWQSQLWLLFGLAAVLACGVSWRHRRGWLAVALFALWLSPLLVSLSRSFWIGLAALWLTAAIFSRAQRSFWRQQWLWLSGGVLAIALMFLAVLWPWPASRGQVGVGLITDRASAIQGEAGAASRWSLLPELSGAIMKSPILGQGFGATVSYKSSDPRILERRADGLYTTFAFEWGWLDLWLKLGLVGLAAILWLLVLIVRGAGRLGGCETALASGTIALAAVNIFSPYLNHPLGIGWLILAYVCLRQMGALEKKSTISYIDKQNKQV